jgi:hypothetical protein
VLAGHQCRRVGAGDLGDPHDKGIEKGTFINAPGQAAVIYQDNLVVGGGADGLYSDVFLFGTSRHFRNSASRFAANKRTPGRILIPTGRLI